MHMYEINERVAYILDRYMAVGDAVLDTDTGELLEGDSASGILSELDSLEMERSKKVEGVMCWIKDIHAEAKACKDEDKNLRARIDALENKAERLTAWLELQLDGEKFSSPKGTISYRKSWSVQVNDLSLIPEEYIREKVTREADKKALSEVLKSGAAVTGAELVQRMNMQIK